MMRIKEAIQRKKLIHEMNEEFKEYDNNPDTASVSLINPTIYSPSPIQGGSARSEDPANTTVRLQNFVHNLSCKLTDLQKRALKITWKRLSEAPKTSGRGTLQIMEKVLNKLCEQACGINAIFYKSAFLACIEDRKMGRNTVTSIATIRDHAHILITLIDDILHTMFEGPPENPKYDPETIGEHHWKLVPLGFDRTMWNTFSECFAEVMFMQECIRAYPHAPSAWSLLAVTMCDKMFSSARPQNLVFKNSHLTQRCPFARLSSASTSHSDSQGSVVYDEVFKSSHENLREHVQAQSQPCTPYAGRSRKVLRMSNFNSEGSYRPSRTLSTTPRKNSKRDLLRTKSEARMILPSVDRVTNV